jgi:hypothetical protein
MLDLGVWDGLVDDAKAARAQELCTQIKAQSKLSRSDYVELGEILLHIQDNVFTIWAARGPMAKGISARLKRRSPRTKLICTKMFATHCC